jgi:lactate 2-monooxygenase
MTEAPIRISGPERYQKITQDHGCDFTVPISFEKLEAKAREILKPEIYAFIAGGTGGETSLRDNQSAFDRWKFIPRPLNDVSNCSLETGLLGRTYPAPVFMAPVGAQNLMHPDGEPGTARAAASLGIPYIVSHGSSAPLENIAHASGDQPHWFQIYCGTDHEILKSVIGRVEQVGYETIVVTVDNKTLGWREKCLELRFYQHTGGMGLGSWTSDPVFRSRLGKTPEEDPEGAIRLYQQVATDPKFGPEDLAFICEQTRLPVFVKGILHPDDARIALEYGAQGIIVSNHGARQTDRVIAAIDALPSIVEATGGRVPILFDSGIRRGADVFIALALGARAVLVGRPYLYGLSIAGEQGAMDVMINLISDFHMTMIAAGCSGVEQVNPSCLAGYSAPE